MATLTTGKTWSSGETVTPALLNQMVNSATIADIALAELAAATTERLLPAGAVMPFAMNSAPTGWLAADGTAVSRSTYAALFSAIGTTHGSGDGSTTFNLPNLRGIFVRGSGSQTIGGITYNKTFAAKEGDAFQGHFHSVTDNAERTTSSGSFGHTSGVQNVTANATVTVGAATTDTTNGTPRTASETRPANIALLYCIKF